MSAALYIVVDQPIEGFDAFVNGKALAQNSASLDALCSQLGRAPLSSFVSQDPESLGDFLDDEGLETAGDLPPEQWFAPEEGLNTVLSLIAHLRQHPELAHATALLSDLQEFADVLRRIAQERRKFHFACDF
jgi:hypothetical protein